MSPEYLMDRNSAREGKNSCEVFIQKIKIWSLIFHSLPFFGGCTDWFKNLLTFLNNIPAFSDKIIFHFFFCNFYKKITNFLTKWSKAFFSLLNMCIFCSYYVITNQYALRNLVDVCIVCRSKIGKIEIWKFVSHFWQSSLY